MAKQKLKPQTKARRNAQRRKPNLALGSREVLEAVVGRFGIPEKAKVIRRTSDITLNFKHISFMVFNAWSEEINHFTITIII